MLLTLFPSLKENGIISLINRFLNSVYYILFIGIGTLLCNLFGLEIPWYYAIVCFALLLPSLISEDLVTVIAPLAMTYSSVSMKNNSIKYNTSLFKGSNLVHFIILVSLIAVFFISRLVFDLINNKERRVKPALLWGYVILFFAYLFGGLLSPYYNIETIRYSLVNFFCISLVYFVLLFTINWRKISNQYYFWIMLVYGLVISIQVFYMFIISKSGSDAFTSWDGHMYTGWGMKNNIAGQITLCVTAPIYLAIKNKKLAFCFLTIPFIMIVAILLTNSRGGTFISLLLLIAAFIIYFIKSNKNQKIQGLVIICSCVIGFLVYFLIKKDAVLMYCKHIFDGNLFSDNIDAVSTGRITTWLHGLEDFSENELFGVGFYQCHDYQFVNFQSGFVPPRYHNIYIQFLASMGVFGLFAFFLHRYQSLKITFKDLTLEKLLIYFTVLGLILTSCFDNHFFNFGPGLNYCIALAFIEGQNIKNKIVEVEDE